MTSPEHASGQQSDDVPGQLVALLRELRGELQVRDNPERQAWASLEPARNGRATLPYSDGAVKLWEELRRRYPEDLSAVHHLAIMYHARAIDLEQSADPRASDGDWQRALSLWHELYQAEAFWTDLSRRVDAEPDPVPRVRQDLASQLLQIHFDIALDDQAEHYRHYRARQHVQLALGSPLPAELIERVRLRAYERAVAGISAAAWHSGSLDQRTLQPAIATVIRYLERDENCAAALTDLLSLLTRLESGYVTQANSAGDPDEFRQAIDGLRTTARSYEAHVQRLESLLDDSADPDQEALAGLALWHSRVGQACYLADDYGDAAEHYRRALKPAVACADPRVGGLRADWLLATMLAARDQAAGSADGGQKARELLAPTEAEQNPAGLILLLRAQTRFMLADHTKAKRDAGRALAALDEASAGGLTEDANDAGDLPLDIDPADLRAGCQQLLDHIRSAQLAIKVKPHLDRAVRFIRDENWTAAVRELDRALAIDARCIPARLHRAQCLMSQYETESASLELDLAWQAAQVEDDADALEAIRQGREILEPLHADVDRHGGPRAYGLRKQALNAFTASDPGRAVGLLREAVAAARGPGRAALETELRTCLSAAVHQQLEKADARMKSRDFSGAQPFCDEALRTDPDHVAALLLRAQCRIELGRLDQAAADLDRAETQAHSQGDAAASRPEGSAGRTGDPPQAGNEALQAVRQLRFLLSQVRDYGGMPALRLQQDAVKAFNRGRHDEAIALFRRSLTASRPPSSKIKADLAGCLQDIALARAGQAMMHFREDPPGQLYGTIATLDKAVEMLGEAKQLAPSLIAITTSISQITALRDQLQSLRL